ncbi:hypothetical protein GCM10027440_30790 [Nocardiopsis coralliicola]
MGRDVGNSFSGNAEVVTQVGVNSGTVNMYVSASGAPVPFQVPPGPRGFVDREAERSRLDSLADDAAGSGHTSIAVLYGARGIGKSAVLRRWAATARDRFPGGQLHIDYAEFALGSGSDGSAALDHALRALGVDAAQIPSGLAGRRNLYTARTTRPTLVVLEGVRYPAQVTPLVPSAPGSLVVVAREGSSLSALHLDEAEFFLLEVLSGDYAVELLAAKSGHAATSDAPERAALREIAAFCDGLPLALVLAAARLRSDSALTPERLVDELRDERQRLKGMAVSDQHNLDSVFNTSYSALSPRAAQLYRALGEWPGTRIDALVAAAALDVPDAAEEVAALTDADLLVDTEEGDHRFQHGLLPAHARGLAERDDSAQERGAALLRMLGAYTGLVAEADRAVMGERLRTSPERAATGRFAGTEARSEGLAWLELQRIDLHAAVRAAARAGFDGEAYTLAEAATALYLNHRHLNDWVETAELGADAAQRAGAQDVEARLRSLRSRPLTDLGRLAEAGREIARALDAATGAGNTVLSASVAEFHGRYLDATGADAEAVDAYERARQLAGSAGERRGAALAGYFLGTALARIGRHEDALRELEAARAELAGLDDGRMAARAAASIGLVHAASGESERARAHLAAALPVLEGLSYEADVRSVLADLDAADGDVAAARSHRERALAVLAPEDRRVPKLEEQLRELG